MQKKKNSCTSRNSSRQNLKTVRIKKHRDKNGGHPHVILEDYENKHVSVGLSTKSKKGSGKSNSTNIKLEINPLGTNKQSYMRRQGTVALKRDYYPREQSGEMTENDYKKACRIGEKAKKKYIFR